MGGSTGCFGGRKTLEVTIISFGTPHKALKSLYEGDRMIEEVENQCYAQEIGEGIEQLYS